MTQVSDTCRLKMIGDSFTFGGNCGLLGLSSLVFFVLIVFVSSKSFFVVVEVVILNSNKL